MKQMLIDGSKDLINGFQRLLERDSLGYQHIGQLKDIAFFTRDILQNIEVLAREKVILKRIMLKISDHLLEASHLQFYASLYQLPQTVYRREIKEVQNLLIKINLDISTMRIRIAASEIAKFNIGDSTDRQFFERLLKLLQGMKNLFHFEHDYAYLPALYAILNAHQAVYEYIISHNSNFKDDANQRFDDLYELMEALISNDQIKNLISENLQLRSFLKSQLYLRSRLKKEKFDTELSEFNNLSGFSFRQQLYSLTSLATISPERFATSFKSHYNVLATDYYKLKAADKFLLLGLVTKYLKLCRDNELPSELGVQDTVSLIDWFNMDDFFREYNKISETKIDSADLSMLHKFDDQELRQKLATTLTNIDPVVVERESKKPHGGFEISDMELPINKNGETYHLCMPFKSGREITTDKVPVSIIYQVFRPFMHFREKCIVVFVTAKNCSEYFMNDVKRATSSYNWKINILQGGELASLLKLNSQLQ